MMDLELLDVELRPALASDIRRLGKVSVESWQAAYRGLVDEAFLNSLSYAEREDVWRERLGDKGSEHWVVVVNGNVAGFIALNAARPEDGGPAVGELDAIYVLPELFGKGLGQLLMKLALDRLWQRGHREAVLWEIDGNLRAERFYAAGGWEREEFVRAHPRLGVTLRRYRRSLRAEHL